jgi:hypothetical protein
MVGEYKTHIKILVGKPQRNRNWIKLIQDRVKL